MSDEYVADPAALWLCQLPGMTTGLVQQLLAAVGAPSAIMGMSSRALRELGVPPGLVASIVAGPRQVPQVAAGLKGLQRLGIVPLPLAAPSYPERLRALATPPLVVYLQGRWPLAQPLLLAAGPGEPAPKAVSAWLELARGLLPLAGIATAQPELLAEVGPARLLGVPFGLMLSRQRLPKELWPAVAGGQTTLLSVVSPNAQPDPALLPRVADALLALADALVLLTGDAPSGALPASARALGVRAFALGAPPKDALPPGVRRLRPGKPGLRTLQTALGIHADGTATAQQERLF